MCRCEAIWKKACNRYLWRQNRRKLEAEAVRNAILSVSGKLDMTMGGPSYQDFAIENAENSPHYEYHLHDPEDPKSHRRAIYRFVVRSQPQPFMAALDCADPNLAVEKRSGTVTVQLAHGAMALSMARGTAALIRDLKQRGLLEDTLVLWTTEFGRMPSSQGDKGRDHNPYCFTNWLCGGGIKGGVHHGPSDDFGYKPADRNNPTEVYDIHATVLHLLGIDRTRLTVRHNGIDRRLTDIHGHVIRELLT
jgi:hypothetical protein